MGEYKSDRGHIFEGGRTMRKSGMLRVLAIRGLKP